MHVNHPYAHFSSSTDTGFMLVTPYYFNLAPNYDATLYPRYMTKRGLLMEGEFRYLTESSEGQFGAAYLNDDNDDRKRKGQTDYTDKRYMLNWQHKGGLDSRVLTEVDYTQRDFQPAVKLQQHPTHSRRPRQIRPQQQ